MGLRLTSAGAVWRSMLARAQGLATGALSKRLAPRIAADTLQALAASARSSRTSPAGRAWPATKDGKPLRWPSQATIRTEVNEGKIRLVLTGPSYLAPQHAGWRKMRTASAAEFFAAMSKSAAGKSNNRKRWGGKPRRIVPRGAIPAKWKAPLSAALNRGWLSFMKTKSVRVSR